MNITIVGGGNIGTALIGELSAKGYMITLYTQNVDKWTDRITVYTDEGIIVGNEFDVKNDLEEAMKKSDMVIVTLPAFLLDEFAEKSLKFVRPNQRILVMPGLGGTEFIFSKHVEKGAVLIGLQRVPAVYRVIKEGESVHVSGKRKEGLHVAILPNKSDPLILKELENMFSMRCCILSNYLCVTLTPSNPILHTTRLCSMFSDYQEGKIYTKNPLFYGDWDISSAKLLLECDNELQLLKSKLKPLNLNETKSLMEHYESKTPEQLVNKITKIQSLNRLSSPMIKVENGWKVDWESRYFKADFPYGLTILKGIAVLAKQSTPAIDHVLKWYQKCTNSEYYINDDFVGKDLKNTSIPQNYGYDTLEKFLAFYQKGNN